MDWQNKIIFGVVSFLLFIFGILIQNLIPRWYWIPVSLGSYGVGWIWTDYIYNKKKKSPRGKK